MLDMDSDNIIVIKNIITEGSSEIITLSVNDSDIEGLMDNFIYKISSDGKIVKLSPVDESESSAEGRVNNNLDSRRILVKELIKNSFEGIPTELTERELENINEYAKNKIEKGKGYGRAYPFSVEMSHEGALKIILLLYNGNEDPLAFTQFPFKLTDANGNLVIRDLIDINKTISPNKIGICNLVIDKDKLVKTEIDLSKWDVAFNMN
jgi:SLAP domain-containing protein